MLDMSIIYETLKELDFGKPCIYLIATQNKTTRLYEIIQPVDMTLDVLRITTALKIVNKLKYSIGLIDKTDSVLYFYIHETIQPDEKQNA